MLIGWLSTIAFAQVATKVGDLPPPDWVHAEHLSADAPLFHISEIEWGARPQGARADDLSARVQNTTQGTDPVEDHLPGWRPTGAGPTSGDDGVVGGGPVANNNAWPDAVGILFDYGGGYVGVGCTGTLVSKDVVITAEHCESSAPIYGVVIGSKDWSTGAGEWIEAQFDVSHPDGITYGFDAAVVRLVEKSSFAARAVAIECVLEEHLYLGAPAQIVGFGAINAAGDQFTSVKHEVSTVITSTDCSETYINGVWAGCHPSISPGGEIAAGGDGNDACFGDSGGPLYLSTPEGEYVIGITSRAFAGVPSNAPCYYGGIWVRPDAIMDWIEDTAGKTIKYPTCNLPPEVEPEVLMSAVTDQAATVPLVVDDPDGPEDKVTYSVVSRPENGALQINGAQVLYKSDIGFEGQDVFVLEVADKGFPNKYPRSGQPKTAEITVLVDVEGGTTAGLVTPASSGCGCDNGGTPAGALALLALAGLVRRRR